MEMLPIFWVVKVQKKSKNFIDIGHFNSNICYIETPDRAMDGYFWLSGYAKAPQQKIFDIHDITR